MVIVLTDNEDEKELLPHAISMYEINLTRYDAVTSKATSQIGFVGVIIAIFGFAFSDNIAESNYLNCIVLGLILLLSSIGISICLLFPKYAIPLFDVKKYFNDKKEARDKGELENIPSLLDMYTHFSKKVQKTTKQKNYFLFSSYILTIFGLAITFFSIIATIM